MGYTSWSSDAYSHLKSSYSGKSADQIFSSGMNAAMNPNGLVFRESRDSDAHPNSLAIAVFLDVTGSMGQIPEMLIRHKLGSLMDTLLAHGVEDPQVMFSAIGDHHTDRAPLQMGQFESGTDELNECLSKVYLEGGGGGQNMESYLLAWLVAGRHTSIDCYEKRGHKGFLFTIGDEKSWDSIAADRLKDLMGYAQTDPITDAQVLAQAQRMYHVFHIHINETGYKDNPDIIGYWKKLLGERALILDNHMAVAELIASTVAVINGANLDKVAAEFDAATANSVKNALMKVHTGVLKVGGDSGVVRL
ncbi:hypothetical protein [Haliscomenobacter hydrossis]|uniref:VWFA domain-containing protein n=1 Tax=Haliscomenobacter hydrossis (strain ATCC 27775 / DSM 1100 / LMG 10767 / O) TaxID=760192 RepID=F4KUE3_HALH1|nr:hypothetical protein [Haliscomenobacter hydrossis]AEE51225.1 hypothetical protein Halhy_3367 [Haliscomenobacter hydrossis DSM 1100]